MILELRQAPTILYSIWLCFFYSHHVSILQQISSFPNFLPLLIPINGILKEIFDFRERRKSQLVHKPHK